MPTKTNKFDKTCASFLEKNRTRDFAQPVELHEELVSL